MKGKFSIKFDILGTDSIRKALEKDSKKVIEGLQAGIDRGSVLVEASAKQNVPVRSGNLMRSIFTEFSQDKLKAMIGPDINAAPYGYYVEFGRSKSGKVPPYPFSGRHYMENSFYQTRQQVKDVIEKSVKYSLYG